MQPKLSHIAAAAGLAAFLGVGGMSIAYAQDSSTTTEDDSTTTTEDDSTATTDDDSATTPEDDSGTRDENCPERDGSSSDSSTTEGSSL